MNAKVEKTRTEKRAERYEEHVHTLQAETALWKQYMKFQETVKAHTNSNMAGRTFARLLVRSVQVDKKAKLEQRLANIESNRQKVLAELELL